MEIHDLLQIEDTVQTTKQGTQRDQYNYFVTTNKKLSVNFLYSCLQYII